MFVRHSMVLRRLIQLRLVHGLLAVAICVSAAQGANYQVLYSFTGSPDGGYSPRGSLTVDGPMLYGTTMSGGSAGKGTIFKIRTDGSGFNLLHSFVGGAGDGESPVDSLTLIGSTLYGTTVSGGSKNYGTCFSMGTNGGGFELLHSFIDSGDGMYPEGNLISDGSKLYSMDRAGGSNNMGFIFKMGMSGSDFSTIHALQIPEGVCPRGSLLLNNSTLYGMALSGGGDLGGTIFKLNTDGSKFGVVHSFSGSDGICPEASLILVGSTLYGMTTEVGLNTPCGTIFKVNTDGSDFRVLHSFMGGSDDGFWPRGSLTLVGSELYGMTMNGGSADKGTIFKMGLDGGNFEVVHSFLGGDDGKSPWGDLTLSGSTLYGMTGNGGVNNRGTIFAITVPEPSMFVLFGTGFIGLVGKVWRRRRRREETRNRG